MKTSTPPPHTVMLSMVLVVVVAMLLLLAGCTSSGDNPSTGPVSTLSPTVGSRTTSTMRSECRQVGDDARALATEVGRLVSREATVDDVRTAANALVTSIGAARSVAGAEAQAGLDRAEQALQEFQAALTTEPVDTATLRRTAAELVTALGDAVTVCTSSAPTS